MLVDGFPIDEFPMKPRLKQRPPLSPFLFILDKDYMLQWKIWWKLVYIEVFLFDFVIYIFHIFFMLVTQYFLVSAVGKYA